ncbi:MAG: 16S rRNA (guanine(527)-N(7))-methyltransferase RsmG [Pyrinomonadaceae bacterium]
MAETETLQFQEALRTDAAAYQVGLIEDTIDRLGQYYALVQKWNPRLHLVAPCSPEEFATRHVLESLVALRYLTPRAAVADIGSGAGLPIIPCLIAEPSLSGVLIEASPKKAVFLREAIKLFGLNARVIADRFESVMSPEVQFVTCRALEQFAAMLSQLLEWAPVSAKLLLFGGEAVEMELRKQGRSFDSVPMPNSTARYLFVS